MIDGNCTSRTLITGEKPHSNSSRESLIKGDINYSMGLGKTGLASKKRTLKNVGMLCVDSHCPGQSYSTPAGTVREGKAEAHWMAENLMGICHQKCWVMSHCRHPVT